MDFSKPARECRCRIHGLTPWPGVTVGFRDDRLKLCRVKDVSEPAQQIEAPGTILDATDGLVACAPGTALRLLDVQPPGKRVMAWSDFAHGHGVETGQRLIGAETC